jgi:hypothetical protein
VPAKFLWIHVITIPFNGSTLEENEAPRSRIFFKKIEQFVDSLSVINPHKITTASKLIDSFGSLIIKHIKPPQYFEPG